MKENLLCLQFEDFYTLLKIICAVPEISVLVEAGTNMLSPFLAPISPSANLTLISPSKTRRETKLSSQLISVLPFKSTSVAVKKLHAA